MTDKELEAMEKLVERAKSLKARMATIAREIALLKSSGDCKMSVFDEKDGWCDLQIAQDSKAVREAMLAGLNARLERERAHFETLMILEYEPSTV